MPKKRPVPFGVVLAPQVAGWHDGKKATINFDFLNNDAVFHHEQAHETIYLKTSDGFLSCVLDRACEQEGVIDKRVVRRIRATSRTLYETSLVAHEITATYIGLKMLAPREAEVALQCLPSEYFDYYETASKVIDPYFCSTNLQVAVLSTMSHFSFGSLFLERFFSENWPRYRKIHSEYQPTFRLKKILQYLIDGAVNSLREAVDNSAAEFFKSKNIAPWDLDSEEDWVKAPPVVAHLLDLQVCASVEAWLVDQKILPYLVGDRREAALMNLNERCSELGFRYDFQPDNRAVIDDFSTLSTSNIQNFLNTCTTNELMIAAQRQSGSLIENTPVGKAPYLDVSEIIEFSPIKNAGRLVVVTADPYSEEAEWTIVALGSNIAGGNFILDGQECFAVRSSYGDIMQWLYMMDLGQWEGIEPDLLVLSFGSVQGTDIYNTYPRHISERWNDRSVFYPVGDWASVIGTGLHLGKVEASEVCVCVKTGASITDTDTLPTVFLKIARGTEVPGKCVFRPFAKNSSLAMAVLQHQWEKNTSYKFMSTVDAKAEGFDVDSVVLAFGCLMAFWTLF